MLCYIITRRAKPLNKLSNRLLRLDAHHSISLSVGQAARIKTGSPLISLRQSTRSTTTLLYLVYSSSFILASPRWTMNSIPCLENRSFISAYPDQYFSVPVVIFVSSLMKCTHNKLLRTVVILFLTFSVVFLSYNNTVNRYSSIKALTFRESHWVICSEYYSELLRCFID